MESWGEGDHTKLENVTCRLKHGKSYCTKTLAREERSTIFVVAGELDNVDIAQHSD